MPGEINCLFTKGLIPFVEKEVGPEGGAALCRAAGRSREYLMADHNWLPLSLANELVRVAMELAGETDEERWARRFSDDMMDWKPSREYRHYLGTYTMGMGSPGELYSRNATMQSAVARFCRVETVRLRRNRITFRRTPVDGHAIPRWYCVWDNVKSERYPTNWGLPRAVVVESQCAARGAESCIIDVAWKNPPLGGRFWGSTLAGCAVSGALLAGLAATQPLSWAAEAVVAALPTLLGGAVGYGLVQRARWQHTKRMLDLQSEEILYSNNELEKKFRHLETTIEQLSLLSELSAAVNATLDVEKIYEQALERLAHQMGYQNAYLFLVDRARQVVRGHRMAGRESAPVRFTDVEFRLDDVNCGASRVASSGLPLVVDDVEHTTLPVDVPTARSLGIRSVVMVPLRVKDAVFGVLNVSSSEPGRVGEADLELLSAVANHVALALDRAESFQTIEELTRGLEDKVRVRTEQLRTAHEELQGAYRELQATQMQLIQREKMASVGQLVAGVAHELNNPIGFVYSNVTTLEDFVRRLRAMLEAYRAAPLPEVDRARLQAEWDARKVDYALKYLDSMIQGIREGAERARKIVRDLRVFARTQDDVWQSVDIHEEIESSLTLLNHLLKDRVEIHREYGELPDVECIRSQMDQVFLNLLANAAQAIPGPGAITIETRRDGPTAVIGIADTGPGIPPEIMGRLFDPFFTTKPVGEGTGLGLSISYEIVKKHGGEIRAESPNGGGAIFTVRIPLARTGHA
ncbi:MAG TPA: ATP-binding protein [Candidatus Deferrimicrobiaceae bacterium]|nr:ATP-binding protein [Candidatus Deferrimicrobiaceae bacterium]